MSRSAILLLFNLFFSSFVLIAVKAKPQGRIVGGINAMEGQFPYQVSLRKYGGHTCGGSIISSVHILTAAHCVTTTLDNGSIQLHNPQIYSVLAGTVNRLRGGVIMPVARITVHERYANLINDIAVLRLAGSLQYSQTIQPISLATSEVAPGTPVIISGWGSLSTGGGLPVQLQWNRLTAISREECSQRIGYNYDSLICLHHSVNNGACFGDSGGPAAVNGVLVGVAGFVVRGCGSSNPDGYGKVAYHLNWIRRSMY